MASPQDSFLYALRKRFSRPLPIHSGLYCAPGWVFGILLGVLAGTGVLLAIYYQPSPDAAYASVKYIMRDVGGGWSGWLFRGIHYWAAQVLIFLALLRFLMVFLRGDYRGSGRSHWRIGLFFLGTFLLFGATGGLLAWDANALQSVGAALGRIETFPGFGPHLVHVLKGGKDTGASTLRIFYALHILFLPLATMLLILFRSWLPPWRDCARGRRSS